MGAILVVATADTNRKLTSVFSLVYHTEEMFPLEGGGPIPSRVLIVI